MIELDSLAKLVVQLQRLPGIGAKSAQRLAFHFLKNPRNQVEELCEALREVKDRITYCSVCSNITDVDPCYYCTHPSRDQCLICVVEEPHNVTAVEKGIAKANLGLNPMIDGQNVRLPMPDLTQERRKELAKLAGQYAEQAKIAIRNVRRDGMEALKEDEKKKEVSEDERKRGEDEVQKLTDKYVAECDTVAAQKEKEILTQ